MLETYRLTGSLARSGKQAAHSSLLVNGPPRPFSVRVLTAFAVLALLAAPATIRAQSYSLDWSSIDGGGGTSTGGVYTVSGTIGQPDAGAMSGGNYTLAGGFWGVVSAVQTPGAPVLSITINPQLSTLNISWPLPAEGWVLEWTNALPRVSAPWPQLPPPYQTNGANLQFTEPLPAGNKFYRLHKP